MYNALKTNHGPGMRGVPLHSVLRPVFFLVYINYMVLSDLESETSLSADDANILKIIRTNTDVEALH